MPFYGQHAILFPSVKSVLHIRLDGKVNSIIDMFRLSFTFNFNYFHIPRLKSFSKFIQFITISLSLCLQSLFFLNDHFIKFWNLWVILFCFLWWLLVLFSCFNGSLSCFLSLSLFILSALKLYGIKLLLDFFLIQISLQPLSFLTF